MSRKHAAQCISGVKFLYFENILLIFAKDAHSCKACKPFELFDKLFESLLKNLASDLLCKCGCTFEVTSSLDHRCLYAFVMYKRKRKDRILHRCIENYIPLEMSL